MNMMESMDLAMLRAPEYNEAPNPSKTLARNEETG